MLHNISLLGTLAAVAPVFKAEEAAISGHSRGLGRPTTKSIMKRFLTLSVLISFVYASSQLSRRSRLHESRDSAPHGFTDDGPAPGDAELKLRIALTQSDILGLQDMLMAVSTPGSDVYGKHLSKEELGVFVTPKQQTSAAVAEWFSSKGLNATAISPYGDWVTIQTTVSLANELFDANFTTFTHSATGTEAIRTLAYSIPEALEGHIQLVHPTVTFPEPMGNVGKSLLSFPRKATPPAGRATSNVSASMTARAPSPSCNSAINPACLQELYSIPTTPATQSSNQIAIGSFDNQFFSQADLAQFLKMFRPDIKTPQQPKLETLDGGSNPQNPSGISILANLEVQYTVGIATGVTVDFLSVGPNTQDGGLDGLLDLGNFLSSESTLPQVLIIGVGLNENQISQPLANTLCNVFAQLGARGVSVIFASGDGGVAGLESETCTTFVPTFPSTCPFVTSVGATQNVNPEVAASFSSGGFSNFFSTPSYQLAAVRSYLSKIGSLNSGRFNASGRAFPDVGAAGVNVEIVFQGEVGTLDGTEASSPIFGSIVALINDRLIAAGKPPLGFLNPFLYATAPAIFNNITSGSNPGCGTNGFPALAGWNPVTGLGSSDWARLLSAVGL
ncbi:family S53 protease [Gloeopeniophorella convolvens]|nr:family S53 protease [Gloeopeniophorella convolvens]